MCNTVSRESRKGRNRRRLRIVIFTDLPPSLPLPPADPWTRTTESNHRRTAYASRLIWRPHVCGHTTSYSYVDRRSGMHVTGERKYESSAVHQILNRVALAEKSWHTRHRFTRPDKLRLMLQNRSTLSLIKVEVADAPPSFPPATMLSELASKVWIL